MRALLPLILILTLVLACRALPAADELAAFRVANHYAPPFASGVWFVTQGGDTPQVNHHQAAPEQMFGVDLVMTVARGVRRGVDDGLGDFHGYGQPVVAPCAGTVL